MWEDEMLKNICDNIWFVCKYEFNKKYKYFENNVSVNWYFRKINVIEIIFTPEFMDKFDNYLDNITRWKSSNDLRKIAFMNRHLDNPTEYLYKFIK